MTEEFQARGGLEEKDLIEKSILQSMHEGVITLECNGNIHTTNPAALAILGFQEENLRGKHFKEVFGRTPGNHEFMQVFQKVVDERLPTSRREVRFTRPDGQTVDLSVATTFFQVDVCVPSLQDVVVVFRDITSLKSLERMRRRAIDHLSHELKTPLAIIEASVEKLADRDALVTSSRIALQRIKRNILRLRRIEEITEEIIRRQPFHPQPLDLAAEIRDIMAALQQESSHRDVRISTDLEPVHTDIVDPDLLRTVLSTLFKNAVENTPDGGTIEISLKNRKDGVLLTVEDHGVGIPVADREFILEGFHHIQETDDYSTKKPYDFNAGGKGLELLRLKMLGEAGYFDISFQSRRCEHIPDASDHCPGAVSLCSKVPNAEECRKSGGSHFAVLFRRNSD